MSAGRWLCPKLLAVCAGVAAAGGIVALQITRNTRYPFGSRQRRACVTLRGEPQLARLADRSSLGSLSQRSRTASAGRPG